MKNLKRALSFAIAAVMLVGMMAIGTGAFTDDAKIVNEEEVNLLVNLGILNGKPDGSFDPEGTITKAEAAKMICVALNGGKDPQLESVGGYTDTVGHWAAGYIDYCTNLGIVAGDGNGYFLPNKQINGTEMAKMLLVALGFNAVDEGFVGADWSTNINVRASQKDLYEGLAILPGNALSRDSAAKMVWNAMNAKMVEYDYKLTTDANGALTSVAIAKDNGDTILTEKYDLAATKPEGELTKVSVDSKGVYSYTITDANGNRVGVYTVKADFSDLYGKNVKVLKKSTNNECYGLYVEDSVVLATGVYGDINFAEDYELTVDGTNVWAFNAGAVGATPVKDWWTCTVLDVDGDEDADRVIVYPVAVDQVRYASKTSFTMVNNGAKEYEKMADEDWTTADTFAKDDYVAVVNKAYTVDNDTVFTKLAVTAGIKVEAAKADGSVRVGDTWYKQDGTGLNLTNNEADVVIINGYIVKADAVEASAKEVLMVVGVGANVEFDNTATNVKVMYADGTTGVIVVKNDDGDWSNNMVGKLYTWTVKDGEYKLTTATAAAMGLDGDDTTSYVASTGKLANDYRIADDAVVFANKGGKFSVISGADLKKMNAFDNTVYAYAEDVNGFDTAKVAVLVTAAFGNTGDAAYGYVVSNSYTGKEGDDTYVYTDIWTGTEVVSVKEKDGTSLVKGDVITYTDESAELIDDVQVVIAYDKTADAVVAYDGNNIKFQGNNGEYDMSDDCCDTTVLYVDSKNVKGVEGGAIALADDSTGNGNLIKNVQTYFVDGHLALLVVDINNDWND